MSKYCQIALALAIFAASPAFCGTTDHPVKQSTQNLRISGIQSSQATTHVWTAPKLHNAVDVPDQDCIQRAFGITIALAC
jgi:hypothetical protein